MKSERIAVMAWIWSVTTLFALVLFQAVTMEYYIIIFLIGFIIIAELFSSFKSWPKWKINLNIMLIIGMLFFIAIVLEKALQYLNK